jgi:hypothetical protein
MIWYSILFFKNSSVNVFGAGKILLKWQICSRPDIVDAAVGAGPYLTNIIVLQLVLLERPEKKIKRSDERLREKPKNIPAKNIFAHKWQHMTYRGLYMPNALLSAHKAYLLKRTIQIAVRTHSEDILHRTHLSRKYLEHYGARRRGTHVRGKMARTHLMGQYYGNTITKVFWKFYFHYAFFPKMQFPFWVKKIHLTYYSLNEQRILLSRPKNCNP